MKIWDPHFHIWDVSQTTTSGHDPEQLFAPEGNPVYTLERYEKDMAIEGIELTGGAFVEAIAFAQREGILRGASFSPDPEMVHMGGI